MGKFKHRHPINGYRKYKRGDIDQLLEQLPTSLFVAGETINPAGQLSELRLMLKSGDGTVIKHFESIHDEGVHLVIVRNGLDTFAHLHPQIHSDGNLVVQYAFPVGETYRLYADFQPKGQFHNTASTMGIRRFPCLAPLHLERALVQQSPPLNTPQARRSHRRWG